MIWAQCAACSSPSPLRSYSCRPQLKQVDLTCMAYAQGGHMMDIDEGDFVIPTLKPVSRSSSRHSLQFAAQLESTSPAGDFVIPPLRPASRSSSRHSLQLPGQQESTSPTGGSGFAAVKSASRSSSRHSLQVPVEQDNISTAGGSATPPASSASRSSSRHSLQVPAQQESTSAVEDSTAASPKSASRSSSRHSLQVPAQQECTSAVEDSTAASPKSASRSTSQHSSQALVQQEGTSTAAEVRQDLIPANASLSRTSSKLDQLLPDPMLHTGTNPTAQQVARQKRSIPLIQQPVRPASPSAGSKVANKQSQGFQPQQAWVGFGSRKSAKK